MKKRRKEEEIEEKKERGKEEKKEKIEENKKIRKEERRMERGRVAAGPSERDEEGLRKVPPPPEHGCRKAQGESPGSGAETTPDHACTMIPRG